MVLMIGFHVPDTNHLTRLRAGLVRPIPWRSKLPYEQLKKENRPVPKNRPAEPFDAQRAIVGWMIYIRTSSNSEEKLKLGTEHPLVAAVVEAPNRCRIRCQQRWTCCPRG